MKGLKMIQIIVKAKTENALKGLGRHYKDTSTLFQRAKLKAIGIAQELDVENKELLINYDNLLTKLSEKLNFDNLKIQLTDDMKEKFIQTVNDFMTYEGVLSTEYEVTFNEL